MDIRKQRYFRCPARYARSLAPVKALAGPWRPGIPPEEQDKLFMPYYSTKRRGSGLGLAIVKRIVAEHRGTVRVELPDIVRGEQIPAAR